MVHTGVPEQQAQARELLEVLTPIAKSWPSEWCLEANSLAIQVHGGYGYTRDFPVEQHWRDNRLNMIHEGTHGIQALDLLGRKVRMNEGAGMTLLGQRMQATADLAATLTEWQSFSKALMQGWQDVVQATHDAWQHPPAQALANAVPYMQAFGHVVLSWIWLEVALASPTQDPADQGRRAACRYFYRYELPKITAWLNVVSAGDSTCAELSEEAF